MKRTIANLLVAAIAVCAPALAQSSKTVEKIAWFGTLDSARQEAARTNRPIFLLAARPCSGGVPGFW